MFKEIFQFETILNLSRWALLIFFVVFCAMGIWTWTRSRGQINRWSRLPLEDGIDANPRNG